MSDPAISLSRRQAVLALGAGAVAVAGAAAVTGVQATTMATEQAAAQIQDLEQQLADLRKEHNTTAAQLTIYKGLITLYETLDQIGIDAIAGTALSAYRAALDGLGAGVAALRAGLVTAQNALDSFERAFATVRDALTAAETAWENVKTLLQNAQELIKGATTPLLPFVDQAQKFFDDLLGKIPFGAGEGARQTINGIVGVLGAVPAALEELDRGLFQTLRQDWFSDDQARSLEATLFKPLSQGALKPATTFLDDVQATLKRWQSDVADPVNATLAQRALVRKQIAEYRAQHNL